MGKYQKLGDKISKFTQQEAIAFYDSKKHEQMTSKPDLLRREFQGTLKPPKNEFSHCLKIIKAIRG